MKSAQIYSKKLKLYKIKKDIYNKIYTSILYNSEGVRKSLKKNST